MDGQRFKNKGLKHMALCLYFPGMPWFANRAEIPAAGGTAGALEWAVAPWRHPSTLTAQKCKLRASAEL